MISMESMTLMKFVVKMTYLLPINRTCVCVIPVVFCVLSQEKHLKQTITTIEPNEQWTQKINIIARFLFVTNFLLHCIRSIEGGGVNVYSIQRKRFKSIFIWPFNLMLSSTSIHLHLLRWKVCTSCLLFPSSEVCWTS